MSDDSFTDIVSKLRDFGGYEDRAADMLEFFFGQMQMHSPKMNGQHSYRFRGGWPMTHCIGPDKESAVLAAIEEVKRSLNEGTSP